MSWKHSLWRGIAAVLGRPARPGLRILGYHAVGTVIPNDPYGLCVNRKSFERHADMLASGLYGKVTSIGTAKLDGTPEIAITFDDGFEDTLKSAAPLLTRKNLPFTVCVTPGLIDSGRPHLTWSELRELAALPGCEIGAHGLTHSRLDSLGDRALAQELAQSRSRLEDAIGHPITVMTWPHGSASRRTAAAAKAAGFTRGGCSLYGINEPGRSPLLLKRTEITGFDDIPDFENKVLGVWDWFALRQGDPAKR